MAEARPEHDNTRANDTVERERKHQAPPPDGQEGGAPDQEIDTAGTDIDDKSPTKSIGTGVPNPD